MLTNFIAFAAILAIHSLTTAQNVTTPLNTTLNFNCTSLRPANPDANIRTLNYTAYANTTFRVSKALTCPSDAASNDGRCSLAPSGRISINATTNLTSIPDATLLHSTIRNFLESTGATERELRDLDLSVSRLNINASGVTIRLAPGTSGYASFTPRMMCYDGILTTQSSCGTFDAGVRRVAEQFDGQGVSICIPDVDPGRTTKPRRAAKVNGKVEVVLVSEEVARREDMAVNPAVWSGEQGEDAGERDNGTVTTDRPYGNGAAVGTGGRTWGWMGSVCFVGVVVGMI